MKSQSIGLGLVGIGGYARQHLSTTRTLQEYGHCYLKAVCDPFAEKQPATLAALNAEGVSVYDELESLLERDDIDAVMLATPIHLHTPQAIAALNAGKHVYVEKPPCVTLEEYEQILSAAHAAGKNCVVGFQAQTGPSLRYLKRRLTEGALGRLKTVWASIRWHRDDAYYNRNNWAGHWRAGGLPVFDGPATNALSHIVHASLYMAGDVPDDWGCLRRVRGSLKKARPIESYDSCFLEVETQNDVAVKLAFTHATPKHDEAGFWCAGEEGRAFVSWGGRVLIEAGGQTQEWMFDHNPQTSVMLNFLGSIESEEIRPATRLQDTLPYLQLVNGACQSSDGSVAFPSNLVEREDGERTPYYRVAGLDQQFDQFTADPEDAPALLTDTEMPWIEVADIHEQPNF